MDGVCYTTFGHVLANYRPNRTRKSSTSTDVMTDLPNWILLVSYPGMQKCRNKSCNLTSCLANLSINQPNCSHLPEKTLAATACAGGVGDRDSREVGRLTMHLARSLSLLLRQAGKAGAFAVGGRAVASWLMILLPEGQERPSKPASLPPSKLSVPGQGGCAFGPSIGGRLRVSLLRERERGPVARLLAAALGAIHK